MHPTYSPPHPECAYVSPSMQGNVTEDAISSRDDVTAAYSCAQAALGERRQALPSRHSLAQTQVQGTTDPIQPDSVQPCTLHTGHQRDTNDNNKHLHAVFCSRTAEGFAKTIVICNCMQGKAKSG